MKTDTEGLECTSTYHVNAKDDAVSQKPFVLMLAVSPHTPLLCGCCLSIFSYCNAFKAILIQ